MATMPAPADELQECLRLTYEKGQFPKCAVGCIGVLESYMILGSESVAGVERGASGSWRQKGVAKHECCWFNVATGQTF